MTDSLIDIHVGIAELSFLSHVVRQRVADGIGTGVINRLAAKHPFVLRNVIVAYTPSQLVDAFKQSTMDRYQLCRRKRERLFFYQFRNARSHFVGLFRAVVFHLLAS